MRLLLCVALAIGIALPCCRTSDQERAFLPGDIVPDEIVAEYGCECFFSAQELSDELFSLMQGKSYKENCTIPREDLRYLLVLHKNIEGKTLVGEMVVNKSIADDALEIFRELYSASYPIEKMRLVDYYDADDQMSMRDNNSSSFNFRFISHTTKVSVHGRGEAIDINPYYNPYYKILPDGTEVIEPEGANPYLDRSASFDYKVSREDLCCRLFIEHGFEWGGDWTTCKDYQHFELKQ